MMKIHGKNQTELQATKVAIEAFIEEINTILNKSSLFDCIAHSFVQTISNVFLRYLCLNVVHFSLSLTKTTFG